jgi:hypothetical protein
MTGMGIMRRNYDDLTCTGMGWSWLFDWIGFVLRMNEKRKIQK